MRTCTHCEVPKTLAEFSGGRNKCKACKAIDDHKRQSTPEYKEAQAERDAAPEAIERRAAYSGTENDKKAKAKYAKSKKGKIVYGAAAKRQREKCPERVAARDALNNALKRRQITKSLFCECCGSTEDIEGHHPDYSTPLDVVWLCRALCHWPIHNEHT